MSTADFVIVGGGIAGLSVGAELACAGHKVIVLEREQHAGMHSSGRSAAVFMGSYGNATVRALSGASRHVLMASDTLWEGSIVRERGALFIASTDQSATLRAFVENRRALQPSLEIAGGEEARRRVPILRPDYVDTCVYDSDAFDVEVNALLQAYAKQLRGAGGEIRTDCEFIGATRDGGSWSVRTNGAEIACGRIINAAGAWADETASRCGIEPIGLEPRRRSAFLVAAPDGVEIDAWPLVFDVDEQFYFKPDAGLILISPANEDPSPPCDAWPEEIEVATGAYRVEQATTLTIRSIKSQWAGLRTFARDRTPIVGEAERGGFFWCAGQGGYGVQMAPALARCTAAVASGSEWPADLAALGVTADTLSPARFPTLQTCNG